jgi:hypothetical protein
LRYIAKATSHPLRRFQVAKATTKKKKKKKKK